MCDQTLPRKAKTHQKDEQKAKGWEGRQSAWLFYPPHHYLRQYVQFSSQQKDDKRQNIILQLMEVKKQKNKHLIYV